MPYIDKERRKWLEEHVMQSSGELNYNITMVCKEYLEENHLSYKTINEIVGALECAKLEFYRRIAVPYEEQKIKENGDVY